MTDEQQAIRAEQAKQLLEDPILRDAFARVGEYLDNNIASCNADNKDQAQRAVIAKQIFVGIRREIERVIQDGEMARVRISEMKKRRVFR